MVTTAARGFGRFAERSAESRAMKYVRRLSLALFGTYAILASISGYRAFVQVYRLDLRGETSLRAGASVGFSITTSGRNQVDGRLILLQGSRAETIAARTLRDNRIGSFISQSLNPFLVRDSLAVSITPARLSRFEPGPAVLRAVAVGRSQWMRLPPPTIVDRVVQLEK